MNSSAWTSLLGGVLIGASASLLWLFRERIAGISGILGGLLFRSEGETRWRVSFLLGLVAGGLFLRVVSPGVFSAWTLPLPWILVSGFLVGVGTRLGNGCTSGHGICGIARLSPRSWVATAVFLSVAVVTQTLARWLGGGL